MVSTRVCGSLSQGSNPCRHTNNLQKAQILPNNTMKVLMVINNMRADSGVCSSVSSISNELVKQGHDVYVASLQGKGSMIERLDVSESNIIDLSKYHNLISKSFALRKIIKKYEIDIVHTHMHRPGIVGRLAAIKNKCATIVTEHSTYLPTGKWRYSIKENLIDGFLARKTHCLVAVSRSVAATFSSRISVLPNTIKVIHNAVDIVRFNNFASNKISSSEDSVKNILFAGRFAYEKNAALSIKILKLLNQNKIRAKLTIAGSGVLKGDLEQLIKHEELEDRVEFVGAVTDMPALMRKMDALLLTSYWEGCPMSIIEAYASNLPVVATNVSGVIDIIDNQHTGLLIDPEDPAQGAKELIKVLTNKDFSSFIVKNANEKLKLFYPERIAAQYIECYKSAIEKKQSHV
jgi:glycosyltransferase involved in cell wall biosynthesis